MILVAYLKSAGWQQEENGRWMPADSPRKGTKRRARAASYSLMAAVEAQMTGEYYAKRDAGEEHVLGREPWVPVGKAA